MKVLLTGSEGYIGSLLLPLLQQSGHEVTRLDARYFKGCSVTPLPVQPGVVEKDIRNLSVADFVGFDAVIHLAGLSNDPLSELAHDLTWQINHQAAVQTGKLAQDAGVSQFVFSSTCSVYGYSDEEAGDGFLTEASSLNPLTVYAKSKVSAEKDLDALACPGFCVTHLRHGTAYGASPMTRFDLVVNNLVAWAHATGKVHLKSAGNAWRPLVHVEDICRSFVAALIPVRNQLPWRVFNIGVTQDNMRILNLAEMVADEMAADVEFGPGAEPDNRSYRVNADQALLGLPGFEPLWSVRDGIRQIAEQIRRHELSVQDVEGARFCRIAHLQSLLKTGELSPQLRWKVAVPELS